MLEEDALQTFALDAFIKSKIKTSRKLREENRKMAPRIKPTKLRNEEW